MTDGETVPLMYQGKQVGTAVVTETADGLRVAANISDEVVGRYLGIGDYNVGLIPGRKPYLYEVGFPEPEWVPCSTCEGSGGFVEDGVWLDCETCGGEEGHMAWPAPSPSMTFTEQG